VLRSLGDDKEAVAQRLDEAGVRGRPGDVWDCALAVYLSAVVAADPRVRTVRVLPMRVLIKLDRQWWPLVVPLTHALRGFVVDFDHRRYPELLRPRSRSERSAQHCSR
jgi:hypothetical protein